MHRSIVQRLEPIVTNIITVHELNGSAQATRNKMMSAGRKSVLPPYCVLVYISRQPTKWNKFCGLSRSIKWR